ncbi:MAG: Lrp/AsnC family transcriptional regulator [Actinobacteria bacterium]|nr:Lrp/AsnC family transcriptional regulator [Actinomycetota bacterium]
MVRQGQTPFGTVDLDDLDRRIIGHLRDNARRSYADIARTVGVSEPTIRNRVDRMIRTGAILPKTRVNPEALGFPVDAMIGIRVDRGRMPEVGARLAGMEHVAYVAYTTGTFDILIEAYFEDKDGLYDFLNGPLATVEGINYTETWHVLRTEKYNTEWEGENVGLPPLAPPPDR